MNKNKIVPVLFVFLESPILSFSITPVGLLNIEKGFPNHCVTIIKNRNELLRRIEEPEILIVWEFKKEWYKNAIRLKKIFTPSAGHDWVSDDPIGKVIVNYAQFHGTLMVESLLAMILFLNRRFDKIISNQNKKVWDRNVQCETVRLAEQSIMIIGYGRIGKYCAKIIAPLVKEIYGLQRKTSGGIDEKTGVKYITHDDIHYTLNKMDHVVSILPSNSTTDNYFTDQFFEQMKSTAFFYNLGRGNSLREATLVRAIKNHSIAGAGLDVFENEPLTPESELWDLSNVLITPHSSSIFKKYLDLFIDEISTTS